MGQPVAYLAKSPLADKLKKEGLYKEGKTKVKINPGELKLGIKIEMEHTKDREVAKQIALDHLVEDSEYYTHLVAMEKKFEKGLMLKAKKAPVGTVSEKTGKKKVAEGKWVRVRVRTARGVEEVDLPESDPLAQQVMKKKVEAEQKKRVAKKKLAAVGIDTLDDLDRVAQEGGESRYSALKKLIGEDMADFVMRNLETKRWTQPEKKYEKAKKYNVGEISAKTGRKKVAPGQWVDVKKGPKKYSPENIVREAQKNPMWKYSIDHIRAAMVPKMGQFIVEEATDIKVGDNKITAKLSVSLAPGYSKRRFATFQLQRTKSGYKGGITVDTQKSTKPYLNVRL